MPSHLTNLGNALSFSASTKKQVSNYSAAVADGPTKSRPDAPGSIPTPPVIQLLNVQKGITYTTINCKT